MCDITVIVVTYNSVGCITACLNSILRQKDTFFEVIVTDNASTDDTLSKLPREKISVIENTKNVGFGRACNLGFSQSEGKYILFLNPDAELVGEFALRDMFRHMEQNLQWGLAGTKVVSPEGRLESPPAFEYPGQKHVGRDFSRLPGNIAWVIGANMVVRREVFARLDGFDPDYFLYSEETDLCLRTRQIGYEIGWMEDVVARHIGGDSERDTDPFDVACRKLNGLLTFRSKHYSREECVFLANRDRRRACFQMISNRIQSSFKGGKSKPWEKYRTYRGIWETSRKYLDSNKAKP